MLRVRVTSAAVTVLLGLLCCPIAVSAQTSTGGSAIGGVVKDTSGAVLPGVTVEASSAALIEKVRTVVTDEKGEYKIIDLRPGTYVVTYTLQGFSTVRREGVELRTNFTASLNIDLAVGAVAETVTVTGQVSDVDVQNVAQQATLTRTQVDSLPGNREILTYASMIPGVIIPSASQDVGGSKGEVSVRMAVHGGHQNDQKLMQDGMRFNSMNNGGTARGFYVNPLTAQETVVETAAGGSAEFSTGGVQVNLIPKDGGNAFHASFFTNYAPGSWQANNLTSALQAQGLQTGNPVDHIYDVNGAFGGPVVKDTIWFYSAHRYWGSSIQVANLFADATEGSVVYTPDLSQPGYALEKNQSNNIRLTWQASRKDKFTFSYDRENNCICNNNGGTLGAGTTALEAATKFQYHPDDLYQGTWTRPVTNKLLVQAGVTWMNFAYINPLQPGVPASAISILEQTTGFTYNAPASNGATDSSQFNERFALSYVTGSHSFKVGMFSQQGHMNSTTTHNPTYTNYTFSAGVPIQLTEFAGPISTNLSMNPEFALFGQDQWTVKRLTLTGGIRFEYLHSYVPATDEPAGLFVPARSFGKVDCVPCWKDISPRAGAAYDLFGDGKTAIKVSIGRYVISETVVNAALFAPVNASVNSVTRPWTDANHNFVPDCTLTNPAVNGECGVISNANFGGQNVTTNPDPNAMNGWGKRGYDWQVNATIQHQLMTGISVNAGYFRTWYGNFTVTDNLAVTPANYDPYCMTAPVNPGLPGGGGYQICGLYDINPTKFGQVNNLVTLAANYGRQTEIYNGADAGFTAHLSHGNLVSGGVNIGNSISGTSNLTTASANTCFVVDSPQALYQCDVPIPYQIRFKMLGVFNLPWDLQTSANFQSLPGTPISATYAVPTAAIAPSLGRNLAGGTKTASISLIQPYTLFEPRINQMDFRVARNFMLGKTRLQGQFDIYNMFNSSSVLALATTYGPKWEQPTQIMDARLFKVGLSLEF